MDELSGPVRDDEIHDHYDLAAYMARRTHQLARYSLQRAQEGKVAFRESCVRLGDSRNQISRSDEVIRRMLEAGGGQRGETVESRQ
jgi:hypothetical protein